MMKFRKTNTTRKHSQAWFFYYSSMTSALWELSMGEENSPKIWRINVYGRNFENISNRCPGNSENFRYESFSFVSNLILFHQWHFLKNLFFLNLNSSSRIWTGTALTHPVQILQWPILDSLFYPDLHNIISTFLTIIFNRTISYFWSSHKLLLHFYLFHEMSSYQKYAGKTMDEWVMLRRILTHFQMILLLHHLLNHSPCPIREIE